ncbi:MAG: DsbA family oxidoreductase [Alphaproteobacteria bacterium]
MHIDIYADTICPWCYLGKRRLERAVASRPGTKFSLRWRPFQLDPDFPSEGVGYDTYLAMKFGSVGRARRFYEALEDAGQVDGVTFRFDLIERVPNSLASLRLIRFGAAAGIYAPLVEALFRGYFTEGVDIGNRDALVEIAAACGLDGRSTAAYLASDADVAEVQGEDLRARRMGIDGVPWFVMDGEYAIAGAQEFEAFLPLLDLAAMEVSAA